jgi:hypothetical protein
MTAGPALNIIVSDTERHLQFPLSAIFNGSTGVASSITSTADTYDATYESGGSVSIIGGGTTFVSGMPMFADSHLQSVFADDTGAFRGEFLVSHVDPATLALFGLKTWSPDGSVSLTFGQSDVDGHNLNAVLGGGTVTIEAAPVPEVMPLILLSSGILILSLRQIKVVPRL